MGKRNLARLRRLHGRIHDWWVALKEWNTSYKYVNRAFQSSLEQSSTKLPTEENYPVDFVVTWVDGSDPAWLAQKAQYTDVKNPDINNDVSRYRDWDIFQYWFRAVEKYAPWVRNVYFVTWGHLPKWLNTDCPKLKIIRHEEIIPAEYLPTFNSHVIEWHLWRIPGLSEHFVYFNDDVFITRPLEKSDFFSNGLPKYCGIMLPLKPVYPVNAHWHARMNCYEIINHSFNIKKSIEENPQKWFNYQYGEEIKYNQRVYEDGYISGMVFPHQGIPFRKSTWEDFCNRFADRVKETCIHRIRSSNDIMHQVIQLWEVLNGSFEPVGRYYYGSMFYPSVSNVETISERIRSKNTRMVCINDYEGISSEDFVKIRNKLANEMEQMFPGKSAYEKID